MRNAPRKARAKAAAESPSSPRATNGDKKDGGGSAAVAGARRSQRSTASAPAAADVAAASGAEAAEASRPAKKPRGKKRSRSRDVSGSADHEDSQEPSHAEAADEAGEPEVKESRSGSRKKGRVPKHPRVIDDDNDDSDPECIFIRETLWHGDVAMTKEGRKVRTRVLPWSCSHCAHAARTAQEGRADPGGAFAMEPYAS